LHEYYGAFVTLMFAWNGTMCKFLAALVPLSIIFSCPWGRCTLTVLFSNWHGMGKDGDWEGMGTGQTLGFSIVLVIWARLAVNGWTREHAYYANNWDNGNSEARLVRPEWKGEEGLSQIDPSVTELHYPLWKSNLKQCVAFSITFFLCGVVTSCVVIWMKTFTGRSDMTSSLCLVAMIKVFEFLYNFVADILTKWENHKHYGEYHNSYLWKQFFFQAVNNYAVFFFLTIQGKDLCPDKRCLPLLRVQLTLALLIISVCRIAEVGLAIALVKFQIWREIRQHLHGVGSALQEKVAGSLSPRGAGGGYRKSHVKSSAVHEYTEEQAKYYTFGRDEHANSRLYLMISLGHVLIFGCVVPIVIPFCFAVFVVNLRSTAYLFSHYGKRDIPRKSTSMNAEMQIVELIRQAGLLFSGFMVVNHSQFFREAAFIARLTGFVVYIVFMTIATAAVDLCYPPQDPMTTNMVERRNLVQRKMHECGRGAKIGAFVPTEVVQICPYIDEIQKGDYHLIKKFDGSDSHHPSPDMTA